MNLNKVKTEDLFFTVEQSPLRAIIHDAMVIPPNYLVLHRKKTLLGIKPKAEDAKRVFCLNHKSVFTCAKALAESISPDLTEHTSYASESKNKAFILFGEDNFQAAKRKENEKYTASKADMFRQHDYETLVKLKAHGFEPAIVVENGFDYNDQTVSYLLVSLPFDYGKRGYLTISRYRFSPKYRGEIAATSNEEKALELALKFIKKDCVKQYRQDLKTFVERLDHLSDIPADSEVLSAVALDIFNKNRNTQAIKSSSDLRHDLVNFVQRAGSFFSGCYDMSHLIRFIISTHVLDFDLYSISLSGFKDVLREKKAYANITRVYSGKNEDEEERAKYMVAQIEAMRRIGE